MAVINPWTWGLGRRKKAVARVRLKAGSGGFVINGRPVEEYFPTLQAKRAAEASLVATESTGTYDVFVRVAGGGLTGQSEAICMGIARALMQKPDLLLADEPTASLAPRTGRQIMRLICELCQERRTPAPVITHNVQLA